MNNNSIDQAVIIAGGKGTRLASVNKGMPKILTKINKKENLEHIISKCIANKINNILIITGYGHEVIKNFISRKKYKVKIEFIKELTPKGSGGTLIESEIYLHKNFIVFFGDIFFDIDLSLFTKFHLQKKSHVTFFLHPNNHPYDSDIVEIEKKSKKIIKIHSKNRKFKYLPNLVSSGLFIINKKSIIFKSKFRKKELDLVNDILTKSIKKLPEKNYGYTSIEYVKDFGTPKRLKQVNEDIKSGKTNNRKNLTIKKAIFLDRDGVINEELPKLDNIRKFKLIENTADAIKKINESNYLAICATNQAAIAKGLLSYTMLNNFHNKMESLLGNNHAYLDEIYFCPHYPIKGFKGEVINLKKKCTCRKPNTGMITKAKNYYNIDEKKSWMIGDSTSDIQLGQNANLKTILLLTGHAGRDNKYKAIPDYIFTNLNDAVNWILINHYKTKMNIKKKYWENINKSKIILIGGLPRSGKSTLAQILKELIIESGKSAKIISTDNWLIDKNKRLIGMSFSEKLNLKFIQKFIQKIIKIKNKYKFKYQVYNKINSLKNSQYIEQTLYPSDVLIIEGISTLMLENTHKIADLRIYKKTKEIDVIKKLKKIYDLRKISNIDKNNLLKERLLENNVVNKTKNKADLII